ncbi:hypothetical protein [Hymenobacter terrenus]|uniref:hypothetical protein n=1 Tax=Hymenobacter terrenus TaxID=1629124 RepID=UPI000619CECC|nr:hypothetical protein [Hymenobacter terrenus]
MNRSIFCALAVLAGALWARSAAAQTDPSIRGQKQLEFSLGIVAPSFTGGQELVRSKDLRAAGQSYYATGSGARKAVGEYPRQLGWSLEAAYHKPLARVPGLLYGIVVRSSLTSSQPAEGKYAEGYFFNFVDVGPSLKYYPFSQANFFVRGQAGMASVFSKNRYVDEAGTQQFFHQFGIGFGGSLAAGYTFTPFANKGLGLETKVGYQLSSTRVEVNGIGDDQWKFGALHAQVGVVF